MKVFVCLSFCPAWLCFVINVTAQSDALFLIHTKHLYSKLDNKWTGQARSTSAKLKDGFAVQYQYSTIQMVMWWHLFLLQPSAGVNDTQTFLLCYLFLLNYWDVSLFNCVILVFTAAHTPMTLHYILSHLILDSNVSF